ncbi:HAD-like domain-containing protein [Mycena rebaudengoi]|nr:HAD-like domain-containing protein [Mycena rebaudengoi]
MKIRLVTFDLLHTLIAPRYPIHIQYSRAFEPWLGTLDPQALKHSFRAALHQLQAEKPIYGQDVSSWWSEVIRRTAIGAGAEINGKYATVEASMPMIVPRLMASFSSKEGYKAFDDAVPALHTLHEDMQVRTAVVSNADSRIHSVLADLEFPESEGVEKPAAEIFLRALRQVNSELEPSNECVHVGDELECDYNGARKAGMNALLLRRS